MANRAQRRHPSSGMPGGAVDLAQLKATKSAGVVVAYPHPVGDVSARFHNSLIDLLVYDQRGGRTPEGTMVGGQCHVMGHMPLSSGANIVTARNKIVHQFLENEWRFDAQWLWMVDADMTFHVDILERMLASADPINRPILGALCFALMKGEAQEIVPTMYGVSSQNGKLSRYGGYPPDTVVPVAGTGAACLLVHRRVLEAIRDRRWTDDDEARWVGTQGVPSGRALGQLMNPPPWPWFQETITGPNWGDSLSEDLTFCLKAQQCGFTIYVDTSIKTGHVKPVVIDEEAYYKGLPPEEEAAPTYVGIPVKGHHDLTRNLLGQLREQGDYEHIFIYDNGADTDPLPTDLHGDDLTVFDASGFGFHRMWNEIIRQSIARASRCNIAILNNDLVIGDHFLNNLAVGLRAHPQFLSVCGNYDQRDFPEGVQEVKGIAAGRYDGTGGWAGFGFMLRGEVFAAGLPLFDERFHLWYGDNDMLLMIESVGGSYGIVRDAHMEHIGGGSQTSGDGVHRLATQQLRDWVEEDRAYFEEKWASKLAPV